MERHRSVLAITLIRLFFQCTVSLVAVNLLAGCVIKSSQLQGLNELLSDEDAPLQPYEWKLSWNQYEKIVYSVDMAPVYVFGNIFGDGITLSNFKLLEVQGLGQFNYLWQFIEKDGYIMAYESGQLRATYQCSEWTSNKESFSEFVGAIQSCVSTDGKVYRNTITFDKSGSINEFTYRLFGENTPLVLKKT